jgi:hypothetical protein
MIEKQCSLRNKICQCILKYETICSIIHSEIRGGFVGANDKLFIKMSRHPTPNDIAMSEHGRFLKIKGFILHSQDSEYLNYKHKDLVNIFTIDDDSMNDQVKTI